MHTHMNSIQSLNWTAKTLAAEQQTKMGVPRCLSCGRSFPIILCRNVEPRPQFTWWCKSLFTVHCVSSCPSPADCLWLYWKLCLISDWERIHSVVYTEDKHWRRSVISMLCAGESQIVFLPHHRCVSACCSLTRESLFIPTDTPRPT